MQHFHTYAFTIFFTRPTCQQANGIAGQNDPFSYTTNQAGLP
ncbi:hypothetical protein [Shewanella fodinae]|uniref:Uncharacterized protein n=1 Tax=Shewanella fodinae TaxID=552357 RepID=A0A4R2F892_9GAMM|nr:hypothetical protein [Shewanella fodinae]TCN82578.1 hypothetical protein EDC91_11846 [Shewanella fodinae]